MAGVEIVSKCRWVVILIASNQITQGGLNTDTPILSLCAYPIVPNGKENLLHICTR